MTPSALHIGVQAQGAVNGPCASLVFTSPLVCRLEPTMEPVSPSSIPKQTLAHQSHSWEEEDALQVDEPQIGRPQIITAFWGSLSKQDRQRIPFMEISDIILPGQAFVGTQVYSSNLVTGLMVRRGT
jgi:hypothetical protein